LSVVFVPQVCLRQGCGTKQAEQEFTADQVLQAGRRAEAEGRFDYALQFYRHLATHHGHAREAEEARRALGRLAERGTTGGAQPIRLSAILERASRAANEVPPPPPTSTEEPEAFARSRSQQPTHARPKAVPQAQPLSQSLPQSLSLSLDAHVDVPVRSPSQDLTRHGPVALPPPARFYWVGRALALVLGVAGWLLVVAGIASAGVLLGYGMDLGSALGLPGIGLSAGLVAAGFLAVFWSQLATALFATANAARDLVAIERAKAGYDFE